MMKVILLSPIKNYGEKNEIVNVKNGYGRYLILTNKAVPVTKTSLTILAKQKQKKREENEQQHQANSTLIEKIKNITLNFTLKGNNDKTFGTITNKMIIDKLKQEHNLIIDKTMFEQKVENYKIGKHVLKLNLGHNEFAYLNVLVKKELKDE
ncbi:50S ribosomal protein L9 [bacterium]|nr:50S ribosomal protein L9 [bacterium]